jgi:hypothetical protein
MNTNNPVNPSRPTQALGKNSHFSFELETSATAQQVWSVWMDVAHWQDWDLGLKSASSKEPLKLGVTGKIIPLKGATASFVVTEFEPEAHYVFQTNLPAAVLTVKRKIMSRNPTVFRHEVRFSGPLAYLWASLLGKQFRKALPPTMLLLAKIAEGRGNHVDR